MTVDPHRNGLLVRGQGIDRLADDAWEAAHWLLAGAIAARVEAILGGLVLNAGAAEIDGRAVVFAGKSHAGKSAVGLHLAASGVALLGDDRLIVDAQSIPPTAMALGLARKVRTPVPDDFSAAARRLAAAARVGRGGDADVLAWDPAIDRRCGVTAAITRVVLLRRDPAQPDARIMRLGVAEAVAALLPLCGRHAGAAPDLLRAVTALVRAVPVERLEAPTSAVAAACLRDGSAAAPA